MFIWNKKKKKTIEQESKHVSERLRHRRRNSREITVNRGVIVET